MQDYSDFYSSIQQANEQNKINKFNYFMNKLIEGFISDLNKYYISDKDRYEKYLFNIKKNGFKVMRNPKGEHKVILINMNTFINSEIAYTAKLAMEC
jgi:hypothetical protein